MSTWTSCKAAAAAEWLNDINDKPQKQLYAVSRYELELKYEVRKIWGCEHCPIEISEYLCPKRRLFFFSTPHYLFFLSL